MNSSKVLILMCFLCTPCMAFAAALCGDFMFKIDKEGHGIINNEMVTSQKVTYLKENGDWSQIKLDMSLMPARDGHMYGFEFIKQNGKAFLNVELIHPDLSSFRVIGSFDCKRIPD